MDRTSSLIENSPQFPEVARAFHIANFVPVNWGAQDPVSRALVDFQFFREPQTTQWIRLALVGADGLGPVDLIIRALSSRELGGGGSASLDRLGNELAQRIGSAYLPGRLTKTRHTAPVKNAGIREARDRILRGAYVFDGSGLADTARILVLDDLVTTGATFGAITAAIHASLPGADIRYFALGRTDPWLVRQHLGEDFAADPNTYQDSLLGNAHLDPRYFYGTAVTAARKAKTPPARPPAPASRPVRPAVRTDVASSPQQPAVPVTKEVEVSPQPVPRASTLPPARPFRARRRAIPWRAISIGAVAIGIVFVTFILTQSPKHEPQRTASLPPPATGAYDTGPAASPPTETTRAKPDTRPRGVINVPIVGLRAEPSISSGPVQDAIVRGGDRVIIVRTFRPEVGPDWVYVEAANHKRGWVIAPVVTLGTGRSTAP
jgi:hypothetical protein